MSDPGDTRRLYGTAKERTVRRLMDRGPGAGVEGGADPAEHERDAHAQGPVAERPDRIHEAAVVETRRLERVLAIGNEFLELVGRP